MPVQDTPADRSSSEQLPPPSSLVWKHCGRTGMLQTHNLVNLAHTFGRIAGKYANTSSGRL